MNTQTKLRSHQVTADPSQTFTLPSQAYLDPEIFELEKRQLFYKTWHYAGWVGDLKEPGDYITADLIDQNVIIIRGRDGELEGFHNVCQHRGHQLLKGCGKVTTIRCPYHAWVYRLDGTLQNARGIKTTVGFDVGAIRLKPVRVEVIADKFVFFNLDMNAEPFGDQVTDLIEDLRKEIPEFDQLVRVDKTATTSEVSPLEGMYPVKANWKVVMENFLECHHCRVAHPTFVKDLTMDDLTYEGHRLWAKQKSGTRRENSGEQIFWTIFPNLTLSFSTGEEPALSIAAFAVPDGHDRTRLGNYEKFRLSGDEDGVSFQPDWGPVGIEDKDLCESVQKGLGSIGYQQGRYIFDPNHGEITEEAAHAFVRFVLEALGN